MSIRIQFNSEDRGDKGLYEYEDGEGREYRYAVLDSGALAVFEKETGGSIGKDEAPISVYGPHAWFSVSGDQRTKADDRPGRTAGF
ncbi:hypothetical protein [Streptomyces sp. NBC_01237]|uniref:hypothetical protein n=1 Tax=Streptomyces sp. NBC_01237 TaxID=2903790 RepID=UPI002DDBF204|nr:hypothetical protein [Streptomyces sp. NBC_01237]WRZ76640.1 hypothetical protein OG251_36255 [Streptomyces sp. NBC_01237]